MTHEIQLDKRVNRELIAHTSSDVLSTSYRIKNRFPHLWQYPSRKSIYSTIDQNLKNIKGKKVLYYGCGRGQSSLGLLNRGANVCGIDLSPGYILEAALAAEESGYRENRYSFQVMDAHRLQYGDNTFDMVFGEGILHHLNILIALGEIHRVLKSGGHAVILEPLADNPLLKVFRLLTPHARTIDERPLSKKDLMDIEESGHWKVQIDYCGIVEAPIAMLTSIFMPDAPNNLLLRCADHLERWVHDQDLLLSWNQYVLLNLAKR